MGKTKIEWTKGEDGSPGKTWNPIRGVKGNWHCTKVSAGCASCYAERMNIRMGGPAYKHGADTFRLDEKILQQPARWRKPSKVFVCSMTDLFHEEIPDEMISMVFRTMAICQTHTFQILTKRPDRMKDYIDNLRPSDEFHEPWTWPLPNVWLGVSCEDQRTANERIPILLDTPAAVRWISAEPLLGPIDFSQWFPVIADGVFGTAYSRKLAWIVVGGESGPRARPMRPDWARSIRDQCARVGVPFFFKQWGQFAPHEAFGDCMARFKNKKAAGRLLDGKEYSEYPTM